MSKRTKKGKPAKTRRSKAAKKLKIKARKARQAAVKAKKEAKTPWETAVTNMLTSLERNKIDVEPPLLMNGRVPSSYVGSLPNKGGEDAYLNEQSILVHQTNFMEYPEGTTAVFQYHRTRRLDLHIYKPGLFPEKHKRNHTPFYIVHVTPSGEKKLRFYTTTPPAVLEHLFTVQEPHI